MYTDTVTLPFPIGALALWLSARDRPAGAGRMLRCAGAGLLAAAGAWLKITVAIDVYKRQLHGLFGIFGDSCWSQQRFYQAYAASAWVTLALALENLALGVWALLKQK